MPHLSLKKPASFLSLGLLCGSLSSQVVLAQDKVEYEATALSDTVTMIKGRGGNIAVSAGSDGVFIIDDQLKPLTDQLVAAIREVSDEPIRFVINTHYHFDHTGGNEVIHGQGATIIGHDHLRERMAAGGYSHFWDATNDPAGHEELPELTFSDELSLHLNGENVRAYHVERAHTDGDSIIHFPDSNVLHMGDVYFNGLYPFIDLDGGGTIQGMVAAVEKGMSLADENTKVIPGHGPLTDLAGMTEYRDFLAGAQASVQAVIDQGMTLEQAIEAKPTATWDSILGEVWITPAQFVTFIYNSLTGVEHFTRLEDAEEE